MKQIKLIIATSTNNTIYFNEGEDYSDITRIMVEDHSPWEEIDDDEYYSLIDFVKDFNSSKKRYNSFAFLIEKDKQISAQEAIKFVVDKRSKELEKIREQQRVEEERREQRKRERDLKKLAKTKEQKLQLLEQLKKEFGECEDHG
jgi:hypothetical protein